MAATSVTSIDTVFADEAAFRAWYETALPRVHRYLFHRCGRDRGLAEELTQETFVEAIRSRRRFAGRGDPLNWVIGIARHRLADHFRRLERQERGVISLASRGQLRMTLNLGGPPLLSTNWRRNPAAVKPLGLWIASS